MAQRRLPRTEPLEPPQRPRLAARPVSWLAHWGRIHASPVRYRCARCKQERRPLLDLLGVEPGRICGSLARRLGLLATVAPYELASQLAELVLGSRSAP